MRPADTWKDYELLDATDGNRLERWGETLLIRPGSCTGAQSVVGYWQLVIYNYLNRAVLHLPARAVWERK